MILNKEPYISSGGVVKHKNFVIGLTYLKGYLGSSATITPTAVSIGGLAYLAGVTGLTQDKICGIMAYQNNLTPAANLVFGLYNNNLYIASTQNTVISSDLNMTIAYTD